MRMLSVRIRKNVLAMLVTVTALSASAGAGAQALDATCARLLPADKLQAAAGKGFQPADSRLEAATGELMCAWMRRGEGGFATIAVQYYPKATTRTPLAELFENIVTPHEQGKIKREPIAGVGKRAAFVAADPQQLVAIERDDAVLRIVMNNFKKAQATAAAKAVAAP